MKWKCALAIVLMLIYATAEEKIIAGSSTWSPFFMTSDSGFIGIGIDILTEIGKRSGVQVTFLHYPTLRTKVLFDQKKIDLVVLDSPLWNDSLEQQSSLYSEPVLQVKEFLFTSDKNERSIKSPEDLKGLRIGIMRGYSYPLLDTLFRSGSVTVIEFDSESQLIKLLNMGKLDAICMDQAAFYYTILQENCEKSTFNEELLLSNADVSFRIRTDRSDLLKIINTQLRELHESGFIDSVMTLYK